MISLLRKFMSSPGPVVVRTPVIFADPKPEVALSVIGDVHGCLGLLTDLVRRHLDEVRPLGDAWKLVFVGDYIDRGDDSAGVLAFVRDLEDRFPQNVVCLKGNHEQMMLDFLRKPEKYGRRWLRNGGLQALASFGMRGISSEAESAEHLAAIASDLHAILPEGTEDWMRARPLTFVSGNVWVVHAGADPRLPMSEQSDRHLIWGHPHFDEQPRSDGVWVVHGHTVVPKAVATEGRIAVDTGAAFGGRLTKATLLPDGTIAFQS